MHQVASDDVKRLEENKALAQGNEALGTSGGTQGAQPEFLAGAASHVVGGGGLFPGLTMLQMCLNKQKPGVAQAGPCFPSPALRNVCHSNDITREAEAEGLEDQGHPLLQGTFQTSLGFLRIYLKTNKPTKHASKQTNRDQLWKRWAEPAVSLLGGAAPAAEAAWHASEGSRSWPCPRWVQFKALCCLCPLLKTLAFSLYSAAPGFILLFRLWVFVSVFLLLKRLLPFIDQAKPWGPSELFSTGNHSLS